MGLFTTPPASVRRSFQFGNLGLQDHLHEKWCFAKGLKLGRGRSSVVERKLPKLDVVGSIPIARSNRFRQMACIREFP